TGVSGHFFQPLPPCSAQHDLRTLGVQRARDRGTDATGSAGHQSRFAIEAKHGVASRHNVFSRASISAGVDAAALVQSGLMRFTRPESTLPAPSSMKLVAPSSTMAPMHSRQRTVAVTWRTSSSAIRAGSVSLAAETLATIGMNGVLGGVCSNASAIASAAGAIRAQWNGAETGSSMARRMPLVLAISMARSIAGRAPEITIWPP